MSSGLFVQSERAEILEAFWIIYNRQIFVHVTAEGEKTQMRSL